MVCMLACVRRFLKWLRMRVNLLVILNYNVTTQTGVVRHMFRHFNCIYCAYPVNILDDARGVSCNVLTNCKFIYFL